MSNYELLRYERRGRIAYITLNRPSVLNAINDQLGAEINEAFHQLDVDEEAWVGILSGEGRAFCSGADVKQRQLRPREELERMSSPAGRGAHGYALGQMVNWKPVIAAVHGYAYGAGFALAMECDLIVAAAGAKFQITEVSRGLGSPQHWVTAWYWSGNRVSTELALTGRAITVEEMLPHGMINRVVPAEELMASAEELAEAIVANPPLSIRANVRMSRYYVREMQHEALLYRDALKLHLSEDFHESAKAFVEKRKPVFKGR
ncbi:MAG: enoyl-CoA hydratase/isomerase family protein [Chloroflexi bacterium]|nr:enoyl-CoA hydratase/isomerase family protein [Chloroflexota bacterium]